MKVFFVLTNPETFFKIVPVLQIDFCPLNIQNNKMRISYTNLIERSGNFKHRMGIIFFILIYHKCEIFLRLICTTGKLKLQ